MNKSLEALEIIGEAYSGIYNCCSDIRTDYEKEYNLIKQDLERLEQLEKENEDLKVFVDAYANARDELLIRNEQLEKENQELRDKLNSEALDNWQLHCKYGKYKKALEILKDNLISVRQGVYNDETFYLNCEFKTIEITKQEYELLKEVLNNE